MNPGIIIFLVILLVGLGVGLYFLSSSKKCKDHETQDDCKEPCQWDKFGDKCIDEDADLTPDPNANVRTVPEVPSDESQNQNSGAPTSVTAVVQQGYTEFDKFKVKKSTGSKCKSDLGECYVSCNYEPSCVGYSIKDDKCCLLSDINDMQFDDESKVHVRVPDGYTAEKLGDRVGGTLAKYTDKNLAQCAAECDKKGGCIGISYKKNDCELKRGDTDISAEYSSNGKQYLKKNTPKEEKKEVFHVGNYVYTRPQAIQKCESLGARIATGDELVEAWEDGADWCSSGWDADSPTSVYPINTSISPGCAGSVSIPRWTPPSGKAGAICYGLKPGPGVDGWIMKWNASKYSKHD